MLHAFLAVVALIVASLLVGAGFVKTIRPLPTVRALVTAGVPVTPITARVIGGAEIVVGCWAIVRPSAASESAVAVAYLAFSCFITFLLVARPAGASCGCAGAKDVPPSWLHLGLNLLAAAAAAGASTDPPRGALTILGGLGWSSVPFSVALATAAMLLSAALTDLTQTFAAYRRPRRHPVESDRARHARADAALAAAGIGPGHPSLWPEEWEGRP